MEIKVASRREASTKVKRFVRGARRLTISSESLAQLLGLVESECQAALEAMAARGLLRKDARDPNFPLYCKD